jgi:hypothetical protein
MTEKEVVEFAVDYFTKLGWQVLFRTTAREALGVGDREGGEQGGADVILFHPVELKYLFVEVKGDTATPAKASSSFNNVLGAILKRIRVKKGYISNEPLAAFVGDTKRQREATREKIASEARLDKTAYAIVLTAMYRNRIQECLDPEVLRMLHMKVYVVAEGGAFSELCSD